MSKTILITNIADGDEYKKLGEEYTAMTELAMSIAAVEGLSPRWADADRAAGAALRRREEIERKYS